MHCAVELEATERYYYYCYYPRDLRIQAIYSVWVVGWTIEMAQGLWCVCEIEDDHLVLNETILASA